MDSLRSVALAGVKLAGCGALIAALGFGFVVLTPEGSVDEADADVFWFGPGSLEDSKQKRFVEMLEDEGFSEPQPYNYNGNTVYFSHGETYEEPQEVSFRLQDALVERGINNNAYPVPPNPQALGDTLEGEQELNKEEIAYSTMAAEDFLSGGMIPTIDTGDQIALNGVETQLRADDVDDLPGLLEAMVTFPGHDISDLFTDFRYVEAFRPEGSQKTQKIAMFGDGDVDFGSFRPGGGGLSGELSAEQQIPACPGCERNTHFSGMEDQRNFGMETYNSPDSIEGVLDFYERALFARGWRPATGMELVQAVRQQTAPYGAIDQQSEMVAYVRENETVHIHLEPADHVGTYVNIFKGH